MFKFAFRLYFSCIFIAIGLPLSIAQDLYSLNSVKDIKLEFEDENWAELLDSLKYDGQKDRLVGTLKLDGVTYDSVGVRYKGNSSYYSVRKSGSQKLPFNIKVNYTKKSQTLRSGHKTLKLSNVFRDPSFVREALAYEIARDYMPASKCNYARLYVNDVYIGLYNSVESVDKKFLKEKFSESGGIFIKCDPSDFAKTGKGTNGKNCDTGEYSSLQYQGKDSVCYYPNYELKTDFGWKDIITLSDVLENNVTEIHKYIDVNETLWMLAFNNVLVNLDSYSGKLSHNYYMYKDSLGVFHPIIWDLNMAFGGFRYDGSSNVPLSNEKMQDMSMFLHYKNENRPLINGLLSNSLYRKLYVHHIKTILEDHFTSGKYRSRAESLQRLIDFYVKSDENKLYPYEEFKNNLRTSSKAGKANMIGVTELMDARANKLRNHPLLSKTGPSISPPNSQLEDTNAKITVRVSSPEKVYIFYKKGKLGVTSKKLMKDDGEEGDRAAGDGEYTVLIDKNKISTYFIVAEADKVVSTSPEKNGIEVHTIR